MKLSLDEHDAERFGCDAILEFDLADVTVAQVEELSDRFDFEPDEWPRPLFGYNPDREPRFQAPRWQRHVIVWLALNLTGHEVSWERAGRARAGGLRWILEETAAEEPSPVADDG